MPFISFTKRPAALAAVAAVLATAVLDIWARDIPPGTRLSYVVGRCERSWGCAAAASEMSGQVAVECFFPPVRCIEGCRLEGLEPRSKIQRQLAGSAPVLTRTLELDF